MGISDYKQTRLRLRFSVHPVSFLDQPLDMLLAYARAANQQLTNFCIE